ncbi:MAG: hypothetical protein VB032_02390 [Burkholderiaceae bacterium]|nr:hypothetical protein [Burkholderiaceae bacterium]
MDFDSLSPEETKRAQVEVRQDAIYKRSRNMLFVISVACSVCLAVIGLMLSKDMLTMDMSSIGILVCVTTYVYSLINMVQKRKHAEARWMFAYEQGRTKRKERRSEAKARNG